MSSKTKRKRERFTIGEVLDLGDLRLAADEDEEAAPKKPTRKGQTKAKRPPTTKSLRERPKGRKNYSVAITEAIEEILGTEEFFDLVAALELPPGKRGPARKYSTIQVALWQVLVEYLDSIHDTEAFFRHKLNHRHLCETLEEAWPDDDTRRVTNPMSRSQWDRHRRKLREQRPEALDEALRVFSDAAVAQALEMGYFDEDLGSLANPHPMNVASGDGTVIYAATDNIEGDMVVNADGEAQQARYDADMVLNGKDPDKGLNPAITVEHLQVSQPGVEQERVILDFARADAEGEAKTLEALAAALKSRVPAFCHYAYDMAPRGASINRLYEIGLTPAIKVPRDNKNLPASALIETRQVDGHSGRSHTIQIYGLDGAAGITTVANGEELFVPLIPKALRQPRTGVFQGFYEIPDLEVIHSDLRGKQIMIRLDGLTDSGRNRPQTLRWINEHSEKGREILGLREGTESEHSTLKSMLPWCERARSFTEFNNMLDILGYFFTRNLKAALAHERRTGHYPLRGGRPPDTPRSIAA